MGAPGIRRAQAIRVAAVRSRNERVLLAGWPLDRVSVGRIDRNHAVWRRRCLRADVSDREEARQVSTAGGFFPQWSADSKQLFYIAADGMLTAVAITPGGSTLDIGR